jgi:hypothetical protein
MSDRALQTIQDTVRLPIYTEENSRRGYDTGNRFDQYIQNLIPEFVVDEANGTKVQRLSKRQGIVRLGTTDWLTGLVNDVTQITLLDAISITAVYDVVVASVFDDSNDTIYIIQIRPQTGTAVKIGSFTSATANTADDYCFLTEITTSSGGSSLPAVAVSYTNSILGASKGYYAITSSGLFTAASLTEITDTGFPPKQTPALISIGRFVFMNGTTYIASLDGRIWNNYSGSNDITTWKNATSQIGSIAVGSYPDQCIGIERYKHHIVAFGRNTIEFFNEVGDTPCPLVNTQQAFIKFGCKSPRMIKNANDILYWYSYGDAGSVGLWMLDGYTPTKLSTPFVDTAAVASWDNDWDHPKINLQAALINQKPHIVISGINTSSFLQGYASMPTGDTSPISAGDLLGSQLACFNVQDKTWWFMTLQGIEIPYPMFVTEFTGLPSPGNYNQIVLYSGQKDVFKLRTDGVYSDTASSGASHVEKPILTIAQMNQQWFGNEKRKRINKFKVVMNYPVTDGNTNSLYVAYLRDNVQTFTPIIVGVTVRGITIPNSAYRHYLDNLGMGRAWSFSLVEKSKMNIVYHSVEIDIQQGSH